MVSLSNPESARCDSVNGQSTVPSNPIQKDLKIPVQPSNFDVLQEGALMGASAFMEPDKNHTNQCVYKTKFIPSPAINVALSNCSAEHPVFYEDEVNIHLNPKIGDDWQLRGQQKRIVTPGQNEKCYLAGALHSCTGKVSYVGGNSKASSLFISLLKHLKTTYRRAKTITLIVDNYITHKSRETLRWLKANPTFRVIYRPVYSPWVNHVERLWQALHETITRNHQCRSMWQLLKKVRHFMDTVSPFSGGKHGLAKV